MIEHLPVRRLAQWDEWYALEAEAAEKARKEAAKQQQQKR